MPSDSVEATKIERLEGQFNSMHVELKVINSNLTGINDTLKEFKQITSILGDIRTEQALAKQANETINSKLSILFKKQEGFENRLKIVETGDTKQDLKLSGMEKFFWIILTAVVSIGLSVLLSGRS